MLNIGGTYDYGIAQSRCASLFHPMSSGGKGECLVDIGPDIDSTNFGW